MKTTLVRFEKRFGKVRATVNDEVSDGKASRQIVFTCRQEDGTEVSRFSDEGDLAQLGMAVWRTQEWLKDQESDQPSVRA